MRINHNISALNTFNQLTTNQTNSNSSLQKLSSGLQINKASDDAAGLAISEKMRGQIRGLDQASKNSEDGISMLQTAEGALNETTSILQRMRELAVQSANDTLTSSDRDNIQLEIDQLTSEIDRIGDTTQFNSRSLLNGGAGIAATVTDDAGVELAAGAGASVVEGGAGVAAGGDLFLDGVQAAEAAQVIIDGAAAITVGSAGASFKVNGVTINLAAGSSGTAIADAVNDVTGQTGVQATYDTTTFTLTFETTSVGSDAELELSGLAMSDGGATATDTFASTGAVTVVDQNGTDLVPATDLAAGDITTVLGNDATATKDDANTTGNDISSITAKGNYITIHGGDYDGLVLKVDSTMTTADDIKVHIDANNSLNLQIGSNEGQTMNVSINDMRAAALGVDSLDLTTTASASAAITTLDDAINQVSSARANLGAYQNRLEHTINNLSTASENLSASESQIRDVDMAKEMMEFTKTNILSQAATAMLAQANQQPQQVLKLLQ